jgi:hypothetical protein
MTAPIMPMRRPCKSVRDCAPTASVPHTRPAAITHRPPIVLRRANTRRRLIALPGDTSPGSGTSRDQAQAPTATPGAASHRGSAFAAPSPIARTATEARRAGSRHARVRERLVSRTPDCHPGGGIAPGLSLRRAVADRSNRD